MVSGGAGGGLGAQTRLQLVAVEVQLLHDGVAEVVVGADEDHRVAACGRPAWPPEACDLPRLADAEAVEVDGGVDVRVAGGAGDGVVVGGVEVGVAEGEMEVLGEVEALAGGGGGGEVGEEGEGRRGRRRWPGGSGGGSGGTRRCDGGG